MLIDIVTKFLNAKMIVVYFTFFHYHSISYFINIGINAHQPS